MKTEPKLALIKGIRKWPLDVVATARRLLESTSEPSPTPLRDIDRWSDQAEVAYYEDQLDRRA